MQYSHLSDDGEGDDLQLSSNHDVEAALVEVDDEEPTTLKPAKQKFGRRLSRNGTPPPAHLKQPLTNDIEAGDEDPFYVFREDLYRKLDLVEESLTEYLRIVKQTDTAVNTHALKDAKKQLKRHIKNAESTLKDVTTTVTLVENQRDKFAHIDESELYERRSLVTTSQDRLVRAKQDMNSSQVKSKLLQDERAKAMRRAAAAASENEAERENTAFIADSAARTSLLMMHQDETLEELDDAVTRVGHMAEGIHEEINQQGKMLDDMEDDLVDAEEKLGLVMGKLAKMLKTKDKFQLGTILALTVTVIVLLFLVLYT